MMQADGRNEYIKFGNNADVLRNVVRCYEMWKEQPREIVSEIQGLPQEMQCYSVFRYLIENVRYKIDPAGYQYIKSPARLLRDREGDCKSMTCK